jgi:glycosyltransferase involved in cell wall biosynthesis
VQVARLGGYYDLKYYQACDHLIANTEEIVDYLVKRGWPREKASYLPNFVDEAGARPIDRASLQTPSDVPVILALGRLHSDKAFDVLLDAMALVPRAHLWLAGEGALNGALQAQASRLGLASRVHFLGWRTDSGSLLAAADCLVCPSRVEPLGNVILEGWIHRKPVVAAASTGPEGLIETEKTGLLVPMEDAAALATALKRVTDDPILAETLAETGHSHYLARFSRDAVVGLYLDFFRRMVR